MRLTPPARCCSTSRGGAGASRCWRPSESTPDSPAGAREPRAKRRDRAGVPVAAGAGDQAAGAIGVGVVSAGVGGSASIALGTSGVVFAALQRYASDPGGRVHAFCQAIPGTWHAIGVMLSAAGALQWLHDVTDPAASFSDPTAAGSTGLPGWRASRFFPTSPARHPHPDPDARGAFAGLSLRHDRGALVRAVLEGVAFGLRDGLDLVAELGGAISSGRVSGGGARSDLWLEIVASVLELPLDRVAWTRAPRSGRPCSAASPAGLAGRRDRRRGDGRDVRADRAGARLGRALPRPSPPLPGVVSGAARPSGVMTRCSGRAGWREVILTRGSCAKRSTSPQP